MRAIVSLIALTLIATACGGTRAPSGVIPVKTIAAPTHTETFNVPSASMEPTLHCAQPDPGCEATVSDGVVAQEPVKNVKRGDVVAFHTPPLAQVRCGASGIFIKRVIGMPGDRWEERGGYVFINGKSLAEPYMHADRRDVRTIAPITVPPNHYFMMGDNRSSSCDSREWGTVPARNLIGKVVQILRTK